MGHRHFHLFLLAALSQLCLGASCDGGRKPGAQVAGGAVAKSSDDPIEKLPGVDISQLTDAEVERWVALVNGQLSPCGDPVSVARCVIEHRPCSGCVPAARYLTRLVMEGYDRATIEEHYRNRFAESTRAQIDIEGAPVKGASRAPVTIVEFSDFQCPYCGAARPQLERLLREYEGEVKLVFKHYPLPSHPRAEAAARAAVAAGRQGKFWEMHDILFANQRALQEADLIRYAQMLGLDLDRFKADLASEDVKAEVQADKREGEALDIEGTPTLYVNGRRFQEPLKELGPYLEEELAL